MPIRLRSARRRSVRLRKAIATAAVVAAAAPVVPIARPQMVLRRPQLQPVPSASVAEQYLLQSVNAERAYAGLAPVHLSAAMQAAARTHALRMAMANELTHKLRGESDLFARGVAAGGRFSRITENVGVGPSIITLHQALMDSPHHRENILDRYVSTVGISVIQFRGSLWAVEDFAEDVS